MTEPNSSQPADPAAPSLTVAPLAVSNRIDPDTFKGKIVLSVIDKLLLGLVATIAGFIIQLFITNANNETLRVSDIARVEFGLLDGFADRINTQMLALFSELDNFAKTPTPQGRQSVRAQTEATVAQIRLDFALAKALVGPYLSPNLSTAATFDSLLDEVRSSAISWASATSPPLESDISALRSLLLAAYPAAIQSIREIIVNAWLRQQHE